MSAAWADDRGALVEIALVIFRARLKVRRSIKDRIASTSDHAIESLRAVSDVAHQLGLSPELRRHLSDENCVVLALKPASVVREGHRVSLRVAHVEPADRHEARTRRTVREDVLVSAAQFAVHLDAREYLPRGFESTVSADDPARRSLSEDRSAPRRAEDRLRESQHLLPMPPRIARIGPEVVDVHPLCGTRRVRVCVGYEMLGFSHVSQSSPPRQFALRREPITSRASHSASECRRTTG